ncbi:uncharacterized protein CBL_07370 [Carabus blaptoides fortunei]
MSAVRQFLKNPAIRNIVQRSYHGKSDFKPVTMNDMPVPSGSWKSHYDAQQTKYNIHLLVGIAFTAITLITAKASGLVYLNYSPPAHPE